MIDNEIVRALERCSDGSGTGLIQATIALINRQKAEIERLSKDYVDMRIKYGLVKCSSELIKAEAIKEFAEKLKEKLGNTDLVIRFIDNIVKEVESEWAC